MVRPPYHQTNTHWIRIFLLTGGKEMHIIVLVKQVPGTDNVKIDPETGVMIRGKAGNIINPLDENAIEEAIRIKNSREGVKVTAVTMGPPTAIKAVKEAIAIGADTVATAKVLAAGIRKLDTPVDLILCGERATDGETGQTAAMIAEELGISVTTYVSKVGFASNGVIFERTVEGGFEKVKVTFPAMGTVVKGINEPGFPTLNGKIKAKATEVPMLGPADIDVPAGESGLKGSPTRVVKIFSPKLSRDTIMHTEKGNGKAVEELTKFLTAKEAL